LLILFQTSNTTAEVPCCDLEPFIPEPGDSAKILVSGDSEDVVEVIDYYSNSGKPVSNIINFIFFVSGGCTKSARGLVVGKLNDKNLKVH
jgi:hypothetical protein